ncbi:MAG: mevalonate kinase [Anaerolineales bacterium]|nr:mevalonate kinase [Anaerolineales bacterium]
MTSASAPGKIILFGEHAVVYGRPALAVPVTQVQARAEVRNAPDGQTWIEAPDIALRSPLAALAADHPLAAALRSGFAALDLPAPPAVTVRVTSSIPVASGLGSGAAVTVAILRAVSAHLGRLLDDEQINALAFEIEKIHHGTPSGIDNTVVTYARPVYFIKGQPIERLQVGKPFTLVIADTGISAPTREVVGEVRKLWQADQARWEAVFDRIETLGLQARIAIEFGNLPALGPLMDANHALLQELTVSNPELDRLVDAARRSGAQGAKLSGGGRGGNMIALTEAGQAEAIRKALLAAGARKAIVTTIS